MKEYFYHYSAGCCGTDVFGTMEADDIAQVYQALEVEVYEHSEEMNEGSTEDDDFEWESDLYVTEYVEKEHEVLVI